MPLSPEIKHLETIAPLVSVIVPCRDEARHIRHCVESLVKQHPVPGGVEIIVADGMSDDGTRDVLTELALKHPELVIVDNPHRITPCGMNAGIRASRGTWIAIIGAHGRYAPDYLARCLDVAQQTGAENVGGGMRCEGEHLVQRTIAAAHHSPFSVGAAWHNPDHDGPVDTVYGGFYRRQIFDRIGLFDESLVRNQDDELNLRLTRAGGRIWHSPRIRSWYSPRSSLSALFRQYYQYGYWKVRVIQKHKLPASWRHLVPGVFILTLALLSLATIASFLATAVPLTTDYGPLTTDYRPLTLDPGSLTSGATFRLVAPLLLLALLSLYGACVGAASLHTARKTEWKLFPILPLVFGCYHFGYGFGFLRGVWDFVIRRKGAGAWSTKLTRGEPNSARCDEPRMNANSHESRE